MSTLMPSTLPRSANLVHVRAPRVDRSDPALREPLARLTAIGEPLACQAAVMALLVNPQSLRERAVWDEFAHELPLARRLYDDIALLPSHRRLPWLEHFARALASHPVAVRHALIDATRRMMTADGLVSHLDQLRWIALRHLLAGSAVAPPAPANSELESLDADQARSVCLYAAFLSHLVPAPELTLDLTGYEAVGQQWYDTVTAAWEARIERPARLGHDIDATLRALRLLQTLPWLLRPVLVRSWFDAARALTEGPALHAVAADALRLSCVLLDSPVPPELAQQYIEVDPPRH
jgi:hypothetical protein